MKTSTILSIIGLIIFPVIALAQTSEIPVSSTQSVTTATDEQSAVIFPPKEIETSARCGSSGYKFYNQCSGVGMYKNVYTECFDGFGITLEELLCTSYEELTRLADEACMNHCPNKDVPPSSDEPPTTPAIPETAVHAIMPASTTSGASAPTTVATSPDTKCGISTFKVSNECGLGVYKNVSVQCYDGYETNLGASESSCKTADTWNQYAKEACANHCSKGAGSATVSTGGGYGTASTPVATPIYYYKETNEGGNRYTPLGPSSVPRVEQEWVSVCTTFPMLAQNYSDVSLELKKQEALSDEGKTEDLKQSLENLKKYTEDAKKICSTDPKMAWQVGAPPKGTESKPATATESKQVVATTKPVEIPKTTPVCYVSDSLMQQYNQLIVELQKTESDKTRTEEITQQIIALKQQISTQQKKCVNTAPQQQTSKIIQPASTVPQFLTENKPVAVAIDRCNEVTQWENKIVYYKKISDSNDDELKKNGFSREEIEKILQELSLGIEKVRVQCGGQKKTPAVPKATAITGSASITETVQPVVIESGQEISTYYKARLEKAVSSKGEEKQIEELKTLRDEIDGLISNLIKSRKELEVSELNTLVKEVRVSRGEIKADDIAIKTTEKKMLANIGDRPVSVEPTESGVLIRDKGLEVNASEVMIKENVLSVGGANVKMSASEVAEKLGLAPTVIELREEDAMAVYTMTIEEQRKLLWFIPFNSQKTITADADNGNMLSEKHPWYNFLTTK